MELCRPSRTLAVRVTPMTLVKIIDNFCQNQQPALKQDSSFFMVYCHGSDHEEVEFIDAETYARTYNEMPDNVIAQFVHTID